MNIKKIIKKNYTNPCVYIYSICFLMGLSFAAVENIGIKIILYFNLILIGLLGHSLMSYSKDKFLRKSANHIAFISMIVFLYLS